MKRFTFFVTVLAGWIFSAALASAEVIREFDADISVESSGKIRVVETITYDFEDAKRHGIYRDIPVRYSTSRGAYSVRLYDIRVIDDAGKPYRFSLERKGDKERIKIGNPATLVTGERVYRIFYSMDRAVRFFDTHDELYWNVTGNGWEVPIESVVARVQMPRDVLNSGAERATCFVGQVGDTNKCTSVAFITNNPKSVTFTEQKLAPGEGLTIVAAVAAGTITQPTLGESVRYFIMDNWVVGLPLLTFFAMFFVWRKYGRDAKGRGTIIPEFDAPDNLLPSQVGGLIDNRVDARDISADIIRLAILGYIKITRVEKSGMFGKTDYRIDLVKSGESLDDPLLKKLLDGLFADKANDTQSHILISGLSNTFYKTAQAITGDVFKSLIKGGYIKSNPITVRALFIILPIIGGVLLGNVLAPLYGIVGIVSVALSVLCVVLFGFVMPARTERGALAREKILGLKLYLSVAEKDRIAFHNAPEKNPAVFEKLLPYAMVLKVEKEWAKQFEEIYTKEPRWYHDLALGSFNAVVFAGSLSGFKSLSGAAMSRASSGGSGFSGGRSGGGFGGGGGGSW